MTDNDKFELTNPPHVEELSEIGDTGEFFSSLIDMLHSQLTKSGIEDDVSGKIVSQIVCQLALTYSGESFYVSKNPAVFARQMAMYADLQTMPHYAVAKKYNVSRGYPLKIAKQIDDKRKDRDQLKLFFFY